MVCKYCSSCVKGWFPSRPNAYVCIGVKEPFVINDISHECTEYSKEQWEEWNKNSNTVKTNADHIRSMNNEELAEKIIDLIENRPFIDYDKCGTCMETHCTICVIEWLKSKMD